MVNQNKRLIKTTQKIIAFFVLISFTLLNTSQNSFAYAETLPVSSASHHGIKKANPSALLGSFELPEELGMIQDRFIPDDSKPQKFVIYVQSAHTNYDSESNTKKLIEFFQKEYGLPLVLLEGGAGNLDSLYFKSFPDDETKHKILDEYLKKGDLSGGEIASILNDDFDTQYYGIEEPSLYDENKAAFLKAIEKESDISKELDQIETNLNGKIDQLSEKAKHFLEKERAFRSEQIDLLEYVKELGPVSSGFPELAKLLEASESEVRIKKGDMDATVTQLIKTFQQKILPKLPKPQQMEMNQMIQMYRLGHLSHGMLIKRIEDLAKSQNFFFETPQTLKLSVKQAQMISSIKGTKLFDELEALEEELRKTLPQSDNERLLLDQFHELEILRNFAKLEMTHKEWKELKTRKFGELFTSVIASEAKHFRRRTSSSSRKVLAQKRAVQSQSSEIASSGPSVGRPRNDETFDSLFADHFRFYELATQRDEALFQNTIRAMDKENAQMALISTGGFHSEGITKKLKEANIPYLLIAPKITKLDDRANYLKVMRDERSFMKYFQGSLWDALAKDYAAKLAQTLSKGGFETHPYDDITPQLKRWRDRIIQNSIAEGRITDAGSYTRYVDALVQALRKEYANVGAITGDRPFDPFDGQALGPAPTTDNLRIALERELDSLLPSYFDRLESVLKGRLKTLADGLRELWKTGNFTPDAISKVLERMTIQPKLALTDSPVFLQSGKVSTDSTTVEPMANAIAGLLRGSPNAQRVVDLVQKKLQPQPTVRAEARSPQDAFVEQVIKPVSGDLPPAVVVAKSQTEDQIPILTLNHTQVFGDQPQEFNYRIEFTGEEILKPQRPTLTETNVLRVPAQISESQLQELQNAWRSIVIADPLLHPRHLSKSIELATYQKEGVSESLKSMNEKGHALDVMATATGKTVVAFHTLDRYLDAVKKKGQKIGKVLFVVNNTIILREAEEKLHQILGNKYSSSRVYEGEENYTGDFIFATTASLASSKRIEDLLDAGPIEAVVFDEVHHVPAMQNRMIYRRIQEESIRKNWPTKFLGFTATETRPDRASVIAFFGREIAFEYPILQGWEEGYLTPMKYVAGDQDVNPNNVGPIVRGTPQYERYRQRRYHNSRFPHLYQQYQHHASEFSEKRGLILAPSIERAEALTQYFRSQGTEAIALTSAQRQRDPVWFEHNYQAWKTGKWPEGSPYQNQPIPEVVVAIDIFREGVDVPAINILMLWTDTDSAIYFMQAIGRGLRLSPFKTHLVVIDTVGLFRKIHLLRYLGGLFVEGRRPINGKAIVGTEIEAPVLGPEDTAALGGRGVEFDQDVTQVLKDYFNELAEHLEYRYGAYPLIPANEMLRLDRFIAKRVGFGSVEQMEAHLTEIAEKLATNTLSNEEARAFHDRFLPAFYHTGYREEDGREIPVVGVTQIVFFRIFDLLVRANATEAEMTEQYLYRLFPEFDPHKEELMRNRAKNLTILRRYVFGLNRVQMTKKLVEDVFEVPAIQAKIDEDTKTFLIGEQYDLEQNILDALGVTFAEGGRVQLERMRGDDDIELVAERFSTVGSAEWQARLIGAYLAHPVITENPGGVLTSPDFERTPDDFLNHITMLGLTRGEKGIQAFHSLLQKQVAAYVKAMNTGDPEAIKETGENLDQLITKPANIASLDPQTVKKTRIETLTLLSNQIDEAQQKLGENLTEQDRDIRTHFNDLLAAGRIRWAIEPVGLEGVKVVAARTSNPDSYMISVTVDTPNYKKTVEGIRDLNISVRNDYLGRPHIYLIHDGKIVNNFQALHESLDEIGQRILEDAAVEILLSLTEVYGEELVFIIPTDAPGYEFFARVFGRMLETTSLNILGQIDNVSTVASKYSMDFSYQTTRRSRLNFLTPNYVKFLANNYKRGSFTPQNALAYIEMSLHEYWQVLIPKWNQAQKKLASYKPSSEKADRAAKHLRGHLQEAMNQKVIGRDKMTTIQGIFRMLEVDLPEKALSDEQVLLASLYLTTFFKLRVKTNYKAQGPIGRTVLQFNNLLNISRDGKLEVPNDLMTDAIAFITDMIDGFLTDQDFPEDAEARANNLEERIAQTRSGEQPVAVEKKEDAVAQKPPFFNENGKLLFFITKKGKKQTVHFNPYCPLSDLAAMRIETADALQDEIKASKRGTFQFCKTCKTPNLVYWSTDSSFKNFVDKFGGKKGPHVWKSEDNRSEAREAKDSEEQEEADLIFPILLPEIKGIAIDDLPLEKVPEVLKPRMIELASGVQELKAKRPEEAGASQWDVIGLVNFFEQEGVVKIIIAPGLIEREGQIIALSHEDLLSVADIEDGLPGYSELAVSLGQNIGRIFHHFDLTVIDESGESAELADIDQELSGNAIIQVADLLYKTLKLINPSEESLDQFGIKIDKTIAEDFIQIFGRKTTENLRSKKGFFSLKKLADLELSPIGYKDRKIVEQKKSRREAKNQAPPIRLSRSDLAWPTADLLKESWLKELEEMRRFFKPVDKGLADAIEVGLNGIDEDDLSQAIYAVVMVTKSLDLKIRKLSQFHISIFKWKITHPAIISRVKAIQDRLNAGIRFLEKLLGWKWLERVRYDWLRSASTGTKSGFVKTLEEQRTTLGFLHEELLQFKTNGGRAEARMAAENAPIFQAFETIQKAMDNEILTADFEKAAQFLIKTKESRKDTPERPFWITVAGIIKTAKWILNGGGTPKQRDASRRGIAKRIDLIKEDYLKLPSISSIDSLESVERLAKPRIPYFESLRDEFADQLILKDEYDKLNVAETLALAKVHKQPIPTVDKLNDLIRDTIARLDAMEFTGDFGFRNTVQRIIDEEEKKAGHGYLRPYHVNLIGSWFSYDPDTGKDIPWSRRQREIATDAMAFYEVRKAIYHMKILRLGRSEARTAGILELVGGLKTKIQNRFLKRPYWGPIEFFGQPGDTLREVLEKLPEEAKVDVKGIKIVRGGKWRWARKGDWDQSLILSPQKKRSDDPDDIRPSVRIHYRSGTGRAEEREASSLGTQLNQLRARQHASVPVLAPRSDARAEARETIPDSVITERIKEIRRVGLNLEAFHLRMLLEDPLFDPSYVENSLHMSGISFTPHQSDHLYQLLSRYRALDRGEILPHTQISSQAVRAELEILLKGQDQNLIQQVLETYDQNPELDWSSLIDELKHLSDMPYVVNPNNPSQKQYVRLPLPTPQPDTKMFKRDFWNREQMRESILARKNHPVYLLSDEEREARINLWLDHAEEVIRVLKAPAPLSSKSRLELIVEDIIRYLVIDKDDIQSIYLTGSSVERGIGSAFDVDLVVIVKGRYSLTESPYHGVYEKPIHVALVGEVEFLAGNRDSVVIHKMDAWRKGIPIYGNDYWRESSPDYRHMLQLADRTLIAGIEFFVSFVNARIAGRNEKAREAENKFHKRMADVKEIITSLQPEESVEDFLESIRTLETLSEIPPALAQGQNQLRGFILRQERPLQIRARKEVIERFLERSRSEARQLIVTVQRQEDAISIDMNHPSLGKRSFQLRDLEGLVQALEELKGELKFDHIEVGPIHEAAAKIITEMLALFRDTPEFSFRLTANNVLYIEDRRDSPLLTVEKIDETPVSSWRQLVKWVNRKAKTTNAFYELEFVPEEIRDQLGISDQVILAGEEEAVSSDPRAGSALRKKWESRLRQAGIKPPFYLTWFSAGGKAFRLQVKPVERAEARVVKALSVDELRAQINQGKQGTVWNRGSIDFRILGDGKFQVLDKPTWKSISQEVFDQWSIASFVSVVVSAVQARVLTSFDGVLNVDFWRSEEEEKSFLSVTWQDPVVNRMFTDHVELNGTSRRAPFVPPHVLSRLGLKWNVPAKDPDGDLTNLALTDSSLTRIEDYLRSLNVSEASVEGIELLDPGGMLWETLWLQSSQWDSDWFEELKNVDLFDLIRRKLKYYKVGDFQGFINPDQDSVRLAIYEAPGWRGGTIVRFQLVPGKEFFTSVEESIESWLGSLSHKTLPGTNLTFGAIAQLHRENIDAWRNDPRDMYHMRIQIPDQNIDVRLEWARKGIRILSSKGVELGMIPARTQIDQYELLTLMLIKRSFARSEAREDSDFYQAKTFAKEKKEQYEPWKREIWKREPTLEENVAKMPERMKETTRLSDQMLRDLFGKAIERAKELFPDEATLFEEHVALAALGSYGRGEMILPSDMDGRIFIDDGYEDKVKHSVDFIQEVLRQWGEQSWNVIPVNHKFGFLGADSETLTELMPLATEMMDARFVVGSRSVFDHRMENFLDEIRKFDDEDLNNRDLPDEKRLPLKFSRAMVDYWNANYQVSGKLKSQFEREPNVKLGARGTGALSGVGGQRAYNFPRWIAQAHALEFGREPFERLVRFKVLSDPESFNQARRAFYELLDIRNQMHIARGYEKMGEALDFKIQREVAGQFANEYVADENETGVEKLMRRYYANMLKLLHFSYTVIQNINEHTNPPTIKPGEEERFRLTKTLGFYVGVRDYSGRLLDIHEAFTEYENDPVLTPTFHELKASIIINIFRFAAEKRVPISGRLFDLIQKTFPDFSKTVKENEGFKKEARGQFLRLLGTNGNLSQTLWWLHLFGFLGALIPKFGALLGKTVADFTHRYTLDIHAVEEVSLFENLIDPEAENDWDEATRKKLGSLVSHVRKNPSLKRAIRLALLLHTLHDEEPNSVLPILDELYSAGVKVPPGEKEMVVWLLQHSHRLVELMRWHGLRDLNQLNEFITHEVEQDYDRWVGLLLFTLVPLKLLRPERNIFYVQELEPTFTITDKELTGRKALAPWFHRSQKMYRRQILEKFDGLDKGEGTKLSIGMLEGAEGIFEIIISLKKDKIGALRDASGSHSAYGFDILNEETDKGIRGERPFMRFMAKHDLFTIKDVESLKQILSQDIVQLIDDESTTVEELFKKNNRPYRSDRPKGVIFEESYKTTISPPEDVDHLSPEERSALPPQTKNRTIWEIRTGNRFMLLHSMSRVIADLGIDVDFSTVDTRGDNARRGEQAVDTFGLTDQGKALTIEKQKELRRALMKVLEDPEITESTFTGIGSADRSEARELQDRLHRLQEVLSIVYRHARGDSSVQAPRYLAASDIHGDVERMKEMLRVADKEGVDKIYLNGDIYAGPDGWNMYQLIKPYVDSGRIVPLWGNHELAFVRFMMGMDEKRDFFLFSSHGQDWIRDIRWINSFFKNLLTRLLKWLSPLLPEINPLMEWLNAPPSNKAIRKIKKLQDMAQWIRQTHRLFELDDYGTGFLHALPPFDQENSMEFSYEGKRGIPALIEMQEIIPAVTNWNAPVFKALDQLRTSPLWSNYALQTRAEYKKLLSQGVRQIMTGHVHFSEPVNINNRHINLAVDFEQGLGGYVLIDLEGLRFRKFINLENHETEETNLIKPPNSSSPKHWNLADLEEFLIGELIRQEREFFRTTDPDSKAYRDEFERLGALLKEGEDWVYRIYAEIHEMVRDPEIKKYMYLRAVESSNLGAFKALAQQLWQKIGVLEKLGQNFGDSAHKPIRDEVKDLLEKIGEMGSRDPNLLKAPMRGQFVQDNLFESYEKLVKMEDPDLAALALEHLSNFDAPESYETIRKAFSHTARNVRIKAAKVLVQKGERSYRFLISLLRAKGTKDIWVRFLAYWTLSEIAKKEPSLQQQVIEDFETLLENETDWLIYTSGKEFLRKLGHESHLPDRAEIPNLMEAILKKLQEIVDYGTKHGTTLEVYYITVDLSSFVYRRALPGMDLDGLKIMVNSDDFFPILYRYYKYEGWRDLWIRGEKYEFADGPRIEGVKDPEHYPANKLVPNDTTIVLYDYRTSNGKVALPVLDQIIQKHKLGKGWKDIARHYLLRLRQGNLTDPEKGRFESIGQGDLHSWSAEEWILFLRLHAQAAVHMLFDYVMGDGIPGEDIPGELYLNEADVKTLETLVQRAYPDQNPYPNAKPFIKLNLPIDQINTERGVKAQLSWVDRNNHPVRIRMMPSPARAEARLPARQARDSSQRSEARSEKAVQIAAQLIRDSLVKGGKRKDKDFAPHVYDALKDIIEHDKPYEQWSVSQSDEIKLLREVLGPDERDRELVEEVYNKMTLIIKEFQIFERRLNSLLKKEVKTAKQKAQFNQLFEQLPVLEEIAVEYGLLDILRPQLDSWLKKLSQAERSEAREDLTELSNQKRISYLRNLDAEETALFKEIGEAVSKAIEAKSEEVGKKIYSSFFDILGEGEEWMAIIIYLATTSRDDRNRIYSLSGWNKSGAFEEKFSQITVEEFLSKLEAIDRAGILTNEEIRKYQSGKKPHRSEARTDIPRQLESELDRFLISVRQIRDASVFAIAVPKRMIPDAAQTLDEEALARMSADEFIAYEYYIFTVDRDSLQIERRSGLEERDANNPVWIYSFSEWEGSNSFPDSATGSYPIFQQELFSVTRQRVGRTRFLAIQRLAPSAQYEPFTVIYEPKQSRGRAEARENMWQDYKVLLLKNGIFSQKTAEIIVSRILAQKRNHPEVFEEHSPEIIIDDINSYINELKSMSVYKLWEEMNVQIWEEQKAREESHGYMKDWALDKLNGISWYLESQRKNELFRERSGDKNRGIALSPRQVDFVTSLLAERYAHQAIGYPVWPLRSSRRSEARSTPAFGLRSGQARITDTADRLANLINGREVSPADLAVQIHTLNDETSLNDSLSLAQKQLLELIRQNREPITRDIQERLLELSEKGPPITQERIEFEIDRIFQRFGFSSSVAQVLIEDQVVKSKVVRVRQLLNQARQAETPIQATQSQSELSEETVHLADSIIEAVSHVTQKVVVDFEVSGELNDYKSLLEAIVYSKILVPGLIVRLYVPDQKLGLAKSALNRLHNKKLKGFGLTAGILIVPASDNRMKSLEVPNYLVSPAPRATAESTEIFGYDQFWNGALIDGSDPAVVAQIYGALIAKLSKQGVDGLVQQNGIWRVRSSAHLIRLASALLQVMALRAKQEILARAA